MYSRTRWCGSIEPWRKSGSNRFAIFSIWLRYKFAENSSISQNITSAPTALEPAITPMESRLTMPVARSMTERSNLPISHSGVSSMRMWKSCPKANKKSSICSSMTG